MNYNIQINGKLNDNIIELIFNLVFRKSHDAPGFAVITFVEEMDSKRLRNYMVEIKQALSSKCITEFHKELDFYWLGRFDQQNTTKYHRDNAPEDSYLMLGYEPTNIISNLSFADYHQLISIENIPPDKYYEFHNPIYKDGEEILKPYITKIQNFDNKTFKIVIMNNSDLTSKYTYGVLHKAEIIEKNPNEPRVINSTMLYLKSVNEPKCRSKEEQILFLETNEISK